MDEKRSDGRSQRSEKDNEEMKDEGMQGSSKGHKKGKRDKVKGIPRKALKNLINNELEKQS